MSRHKPGLSSPPVVAGVFVVLAVLIVVNVRTFAPRRPRARPSADAEVRVQAYPSMPIDLEDVMRSSLTPDGFGSIVAGPRPDVARDPFTSASVDPPPAAVTAPQQPRPRVSTAGEPACEAVMLGAGRPAALIDGRLVRVGDQVRQYVVERIDARGVALAGPRSLFLPVGIASAGEGANSIVTGAVPGARAGRGGLVEYAESERN